MTLRQGEVQSISLNIYFINIASENSVSFAGFTERFQVYSSCVEIGDWFAVAKESGP